jgi:uncharacterized membrane protein
MSPAGSERGKSGVVCPTALGLLALLAVTGLAAPPAHARQPRPFLVDAVASGMVIRQEPRPTSPRVGEIPAAARGLFASGRRHRSGREVWHEVQYRGVRGWVNAPRLLARPTETETPAAPPGEAGVFVEDLVCLGRSPNWKLVVDRDGSVACSAGCTGVDRLHAIPAQRDKGRQTIWRMAIRDEQDNDVMLVSLRYTGQCQDAAGERYAYRVNTLSADGTRQSGCCNRVARPTITADR